MGVIDITVGEDNLVHILFGDQGGQFFLVNDRDTSRIERAGQFGGIRSPIDVGDLGRCESYDLIGSIIPVAAVEVVKISACRTHDDNASGSCHGGTLLLSVLLST